jgi:hypothetical protein
VDSTDKPAKSSCFAGILLKAIFRVVVSISLVLALLKKTKSSAAKVQPNTSTPPASPLPLVTTRRTTTADDAVRPTGRRDPPASVPSRSSPPLLPPPWSSSRPRPDPSFVSMAGPLPPAGCASPAVPDSGQVLCRSRASRGFSLRRRRSSGCGSGGGVCDV